MNPDDGVFKEIHLGSFFPDQQLYTRISGSTKHAAGSGSFMSNDLRTPPAAASPSEVRSKIYPIYSCSCCGHAPFLYTHVSTEFVVKNRIKKLVCNVKGVSCHPSLPP